MLSCFFSDMYWAAYFIIAEFSSSLYVSLGGLSNQGDYYYVVFGWRQKPCYEYTLLADMIVECVKLRKRLKYALS